MILIRCYYLVPKARHDKLIHELIMKVNGNPEIVSQKQKRKFFLPHQDLNSGVVYFDQPLGAAHSKHWSKYLQPAFWCKIKN